MADTFNKRLSSDDVFNIPYEANKQWDIESSSFEKYNVFGVLGINPTASNIKDYTEENLLYKSVLSTFYSEFYPTQSLSTSSYHQTPNYTSSLTSTNYIVSGGLRIGNPTTTIKNFPTNPESEIYILNIPNTVYSNKLLPTTVEIELKGGYKINDDGEYNLYWSGSTVDNVNGGQISQSQHIGNVFYERGIMILTSVPDVTLMVNTITTIDIECGNPGTITVTTTGGSGNFTYELIETGTIITPPVDTNTATFTISDSGEYNIKITDNDTGLIDTQSTNILSNPLPEISYAYITASNVTETINNQYEKELIIDYDIEFYYWNGSTYVKGIPSGVSSIDLEVETYDTFITNYADSGLGSGRSISALTSPLRPSIPLKINVNSSNININQQLFGTNHYSMSCALDRNFSSQERHRSDEFTITSSDTLTIQSIQRLSTPSPSTSQQCLSTGSLEYSTGVYAATQNLACGNSKGISFRDIPPTVSPYNESIIYINK